MMLSLRSSLLVVLLSTVSAYCADPFNGIKPERELFITNPTVVDDVRAKYPGPWSFGGLVNELVGEDKSGVCVREWLKTWVLRQTVNGFEVPPRAGIMEKVIEPWQRRDGFDPKSGQPWTPKMENAPFRLLAIVNRMDLCASQVADVVGTSRAQWNAQGKLSLFAALLDRATRSATVGEGKPRPKITVPALMPLDLASFEKNSERGGFGSRSIGPYGGKGAGENPQFGEGRLIFGAVDEKGLPLAGGWTVIFEYQLAGKKPEKRTSSHLPVSEWAMLWHKLGYLDPSTAAFREQLETVTRSFTHRLPNGGTSSLGQLRTSEAAFGQGREFRQFKLDNDAFKPAPLAQTPAPEFTKKDGPETRVLAQFLREGAPLIRTGIHVVPEGLQLRNEVALVLGGNAIIPTENPAFQWNPKQGVPGPVRRVFSLNTCTGCHAGETECSGLHVSPRAEGSWAVLSPFLRMDGTPLHVYDKASAQKVEFHEMEERAAIFGALLDMTDAKRLEVLRTVLRERSGRSH